MEVPDRTVFRRNRQLDEIKDGESGDGSPLPDEKWSLAIVVNTDVEAAVGETQPIWIFFNGYVDSLFKVLNQGAGEGEQGQGEGEQKSGSADDPASAKKAGRGAFGWLCCCCGSGVSAEELAKEDRASKDGARASSDAGADGSAAAAQDEDGSPGEDLGKGMRPGGGGNGQTSEDSGEDGASDNDRDAADGESAGGRDGGGGRARPAVPSINTGADGLSLDEWKAQGRAAEQGSEPGDGIGGKEGAAGAGHAIVPFSPQGKGTAKDGEKRSVRFDAGTKEDDDEDWQSGGGAEEEKEAAHAGGTVESATGADRQSIAGDGSRPEPVAPAG